MNSKKKLYNAAFSAQLPCLARHSLLGFKGTAAVNRAYNS